jgi:hypothetical protein
VSGARKKPPARQVGVKALAGSAEARKTAAIVLESVCGLSSVEEASAKLGVAVPRYYVLETRALQGLIGALEPRARGRQLTDESRLARLAKENIRLTRDVRRYQALHRAATRAIGVATQIPKPVDNGTRKRRQRRRARAERVIGALRRPQEVSGEQGDEAAPEEKAS